MSQPRASSRSRHAVRLDALGHDLEPEVVAEVDRRAHDHGVVVALQHAQHERLVDLQLVDRQALEVAERRVAGAEVVDREPHAELAQPLEHGARADRVGQHRVLGDLQLQPAGLDVPCASSSSATSSGKRRSSRSRAGDVDRDAEVDALVAASARHCASAVSSTCEVSARIRPVCSASGTKRSGDEQAVLGVLPAHERLDAADRDRCAGRPAAGSRR